MIRVFIAGKYSDDNIIGVLKNIRIGQQAAVKVLKLGMAPFCPFLDYQYGLHSDLTMDQYKDSSLAFLEVCDAVLALPSVAESPGGRVELQRARQLGIPIFKTIGAIVTYRKKLITNHRDPTKPNVRSESDGAVYGARGN